MKHALINAKKKYTIIKKRYVALLFVLLALAIANNYRFLESTYSEKAADEAAGKEVTNWTGTLLGKISEKWDANEVLSHAHPVLLGNIKTAGRNMQEDFKPLSELGALRKDNCVLVNYGTSKSRSDRFAIATISCNPQYERGTANVIIELKRDHLQSPWLITAFTFNLMSIVREQ